MNIAFRVDASERIGTGHLMRCLALADALQKLGARTLFICRHISRFLSTRVTQAGHELITLPPAGGSGESGYGGWLGTSQSRDAADTSAALKERDWDWLIVDHYALDARWEEAVRPLCAGLLVVDDLANRPHNCDVLLDQNLASSPDRYGRLVPATARRFEGPAYALLRPEFRLARDSLTTSPARNHLNIFFGGIDAAGATLKILDLIAAIPARDFLVDVICGMGNRRLEEVRQACSALAGATLHVEPPSMAALFSESTLALGAGGTTSWERCCVGLPTIIVSVAQNQLAGSEALSRARAAINLGPLEQLSPEKLSAMIVRLIAKPRLLAAIGKRARALVDGRGTERISVYLMRKSVQFRPARLEDARQAWEWRNDKTIRRNSFDPAPLSWETHLAWWDEAIRANDRNLLVAHCGSQDVGILRFDERGDEAVVSIYLDPGLMGLGLGNVILCAGEAWLKTARPALRVIRAEILADNLASVRTFEMAGYRREKEGAAWIRELFAR
jgi:UDP-2,4-diacetamido-2,4,6-trideoxy-beta-L-altropyranose hydrolase